MPEIDLSENIPPEAKWVKLEYTLKAIQPHAELIARVWSGILDDAVVLKGESGEVIVKLDKPQSISYQRPVTVELTLHVVAYKEGD